MKKRFLFTLGFILCLVLNSYAQKPLRIAISKCHPNGQDTLWLKHYDSTVQFVNLYGKGYAIVMHLLQQCNGLLLTGGEDINPAYYNKDSNEIKRCGTLDGYRDTLESDAILYAMKLNMPVFAICRGAQMMNVANGGTLTIDIPTDVNHALRHNTTHGKPATHEVSTETSSGLYKITGQKSAVVNSFHHQCVKDIAKGFHKAASSKDGVCEAIEADDPKVYLIGVQWHPERLAYNSPMSQPLAISFLKAAAAFRDKALH